MLERKEITTDLCVVGGGIAGVVTAIACAREGGKVVLMQERPVLGGNASSEIRMWICGAQGKNMRETGIIEEIFLNNNFYNPTKNPYIFDAILLKLVEAESNITLLLNCTCMDAKTENGKYEYGRNIRIKEVTGYQMTTQTFFDVKARFYADCSGDSILAPLTGAEWTTGREGASEFNEQTKTQEGDSLTMGNSCLLQFRETEGEVPFVKSGWATELSLDNFKHRVPKMYSEGENFWYLELGGNRNTIADSEDISKELHKLALGTFEHIKSENKYRAENFALDFLGYLPGKRESRRYIGEYIIKQPDISAGVKFADAVAYGGWSLDDHYPDGFYHKGEPNTHVETAVPYQIPYRILYSKNVENLFFAGRNISSTHMALSSLRVMATCGVMGQAVGTAAALAVKYNLTPHGVYEDKITELQNRLLDNDCFIPYIKREIAVECEKLSQNGKLCDGEDRQNAIYGDKTCGVLVDNNKSLWYDFKQPLYVKSVHVVFDSDLERASLNGGKCERDHVTRCNTLLNSPILIMPKTLCKEYELNIFYPNGKIENISVKDNIVRFLHKQINAEVVKIELKPISNYGDSDKTRVFSFDFN